MDGDGEKISKIEELIEAGIRSGGSELANYQLFIIGLCDALGVPRPDMAQERTELNDYVFERRVDFKHLDGTRTAGRIDCYKRGCFILEAKQSRKRVLLHASAGRTQATSSFQSKRDIHAAHRVRGWDQVMLAARKQAEDYARALPVDHGYPPFLIVADVGNVIEVFADFSGQGKNYAHFPDRQSFRIRMDDLRDPDIQQRLRSIWTNPTALDPTRLSAEVTRDIAERLARIAKRLEVRHDPKDVAEFLMRCLFTMFAEDVNLIPEKGFYTLLGQMRETPENFVAALETLWAVMDAGGYAPHLNATLKKFNGYLFKKQAALPLEQEDIHELWVAAGKNWSNVEPAIFGTLLERALNPRERSKLGAHYTPRVYVERLVVPTIIEPLRADWDLIKGQVKEFRDKGNGAGAIAVVKGFHHKLCTTRVLDPACGTGNFLYVSLELMKRLEGEVFEALDDLGDDQRRLAMDGETVSPRQFYGLELNPRAVPIADLVLWIGYLKWQLKTAGLSSITEPVLHAYGTIRRNDAILSYDMEKAVLDGSGKALSRWDGVTTKLHPITGEPVPDLDAQVPISTYVNPQAASWPEVEFIVGNPPFISGRELRSELGDGYVDALGRAYPRVPKNVDFVMYFWHQALKSGSRSIGFVSTSRLRLQQNNKVFAKALEDGGQHLYFAVPDHRWPDDTGSASVRICMASAGRDENTPRRVVWTPDADQTASVRYEEDQYSSLLRTERVRFIPPNLNPAISQEQPQSLLANAGLGSAGVKPYARGFIVGDSSRLDHPTRPFANGATIGQGREFMRILDVNHLSLDDLRSGYPVTYQYLLETVYPHRAEERNPRLRSEWWRYEANRNDLREALTGSEVYFATLENSPRRYFSALDEEVLPDQKLRVVASNDFALFAILNSRLHELFSVKMGGRTGKANTPVYNSRCFDEFPFPLAISARASSTDPRYGLQERLRELGKRLDTFRKARLQQHSFLSMTGLYNALERLREAQGGFKSAPFSEMETDIHQAGLISVLSEIHDDMDRATFTAYGWEDLIPDVIGKPGATAAMHAKNPTLLKAEEEMLRRLIRLNHERAEGEKRGVVHWTRAEYQSNRFRGKVPALDETHVGILDVDIPDGISRPKWPDDGLEQIRLVRDLLANASSPTPSGVLTSVFEGRNTSKRRGRVAEVLETLVATGVARSGEVDGQMRYFLPR
ncbi:class I SAM-dependent DNA methyltransferase [Rhizobium sp. LjRoot30]|uniref:class I SAM-dependent DNA methyltransferase n=1 Tax=Rhizobium sp. LjRoot30 TaxID=3342320 RepID=UPI003ECE0680